MAMPTFAQSQRPLVNRFYTPTAILYVHDGAAQRLQVAAADDDGLLTRIASHCPSSRLHPFIGRFSSSRSKLSNISRSLSPSRHLVSPASIIVIYRCQLFVDSRVL